MGPRESTEGLPGLPAWMVLVGLMELHWVALSFVPNHHSTENVPAWMVLVGLMELHWVALSGLQQALALNSLSGLACYSHSALVGRDWGVPLAAGVVRGAGTHLGHREVREGPGGRNWTLVEKNLVVDDCYKSNDYPSLNPVH